MSTEQSAEKHVAVYCGSRPGANAAFLESARALGRGLGAAGITMVTGGGRLGLMGAAAQGCLETGGRVIGVIPEALMHTERAHEELTELHIVKNMHDRKAMMHGLADAFCILPGGVGTLDEFFEVMAWNQLEIHQKPAIVVNINGVWDGLSELLSNMRAAEFVPDSTLRWAHQVTSADGALATIAHLLHE